MDIIEKKEVQSHVIRCCSVLGKSFGSGVLIEGIRNHHEWYNGDDYPDGLAADKISLIGRIIAVADAYDAMTSKRPYRKVFTQQEAIAELKRLAGVQFDGDIVKVFSKVIL